MPYRSRALNWNLLLQPTMAGLDTEANASSRFASTLLGAGQAIGGGLKDKRLEAESKRRFDANQADELRRETAANTRSDREFDLRRREFDLRAQERQADDTALMDLVTNGSEKAQAEYASTGQVSPETSTLLQQGSDALGGPEATQGRLSLRAEKAGCAGGTCALPGAPKGDGKTDFQRDVPMYANDPQAQEDLGYRPDGSRQPRWNDGGGLSLKAKAPDLSLRPAPLVGVNGGPMAPSEEKYGEAERIAREAKSVLARKTRIERKLDSGKGLSDATRKAADLEIDNLETVLAALGDRHGSATRQAEQAKAKEAEAAARAEKARAATEVAVAKSRDDITDLIAWSDDPEGARERYGQADLANPETRSRIAVEHTRREDARKLADAERRSKALTDKERPFMESYVEADRDLMIPDASVLGDAELRKAFDTVKAKLSAAPKVAADQANKDRSFDLSKSKGEESNASRDAAREITERKYSMSLATRIAKLRGELAGMEKDEPGARAKWDEVGALEAEKAEFDKGRTEPAAVSYPSWLQPEGRAEWDALSDDAKAKVLKAKGR